MDALSDATHLQEPLKPDTSFPEDTQRSRNITFGSTVSVVLIPSRRQYSDEERKTLWGYRVRNHNCESADEHPYIDAVTLKLVIPEGLNKYNRVKDRAYQQASCDISQAHTDERKIKEFFSILVMMMIAVIIM